jgi:hypothetical protein
MVPDRWYNG